MRIDRLHNVYCMDAAACLPTLPAASVQTIVTSPNYWALRLVTQETDIGAESTPDLYAETIVRLCAQLARVLKPDGTLWLNLGDVYARKTVCGGSSAIADRWQTAARANDRRANQSRRPWAPGLKTKDLCGIPWTVALALRAWGWYLRSEIIWQKSDPVPESCRDRPTRAHESLFLLTLRPRYKFRFEAWKEPATSRPGTRNRRTVWKLHSAGHAGHPATFPEKLVEPCILAGSDPGDLVLDPFAGSGTVAAVAARLGRRSLSIEKNSAYCNVIADRLAKLTRGPTNHIDTHK